MVWYTGPIIAVIHDVVPNDVKATAQALYILLIHLLGDTFSPAIVGKLADLYSLQTALLLPAVINVVAGCDFPGRLSSGWGRSSSVDRKSLWKLCTIYRARGRGVCERIRCGHRRRWARNAR